MSRKAIIVHSPHAGRSARLGRALGVLRESDVEIAELLPVSALRGKVALGERWKEAGISLVVAAGGDGLVGGVTTQIVASGLPLGILPLGTANDVARSVRIPLDPRQAARTIVDGVPVEIDIGCAYPVTSQAAPDQNPDAGSSMYFTHALTVGMNVHFAQVATNATIRQRLGILTYPFAVLAALRHYRPVEVAIRFDDLITRSSIADPQTRQKEPVVLRCKAAQVTAINTPVFWGALQMEVPGVDLHDRLLDVVIVEHAGIGQLLWRSLRFFGAQRHHPPTDQRGWHARQHSVPFAAGLSDIAGIHHVQTHGVTITALDGAHDATLDGEVRGRTPLRAQVAAERLRLIVPAASPLVSKQRKVLQQEHPL